MEASIMPVGGLELLILLIIILLFFGAKRVPELAKSVGMGARELKKAASEDANEGGKRPASEGADGGEVKAASGGANESMKAPPRARTEASWQQPRRPPRQSEMGRALRDVSPERTRPWPPSDNDSLSRVQNAVRAGPTPASGWLASVRALARRSG